MKPLLALGLMVLVAAGCSSGRTRLSTSSTTTVAPPTLPPSTSIAPTSSTTSSPTACNGSQFAVRVTTDKTTYSTGQTVMMTLSVTNDGSPCTGTEGSGPCWDGITASNASGAVWVSNPGPYACPAMIIESVPAGWTDSDHIQWRQQSCPGPGSQCTEAQVPPGRYSITGHWMVGSPTTDSPPVAIQITGA